MKIYITAQALQKREMETRLATRMSDVIEHMLKLYLMPNHSARNHWETEIYTFIHSVEKLKQSKKYPTKEQIYSWTYDKVQDLVTDTSWMTLAIEDICDQYNIQLTISINTVIYELDNLCIIYFSWLSENLSERGRLTNREIYQKLDELF